MVDNAYLLTLPQLLSAKQKIGHVAAFYDPLKSSLKSFDSDALNPTQFREQLRQNFSIILTDEELGAIVLLFDKDGDGTVSSVEFINEFFRLGKLEKEKYLTAQRNERIRKERNKAKDHRDTEAKFLKYAELKVSTTWTKEEEESAIKKMTKLAFTYDPSKGGFKAFFDSVALTGGKFREQMRQSFGIYLSPAETGYLMTRFDKDNNGMLNSQEFLVEFFRIGKVEKEKHTREHAEITETKRLETITRDEQMKEKYGKLLIAKTSPATDADRVSAKKKITEAAMKFNGDSIFANLQKSFESAELTPTEFKQVLKANFLLHLSPGELDAIVQEFDKNNDKEISCAEFMSTFYKLQIDERSKKNVIQNRETKSRMESRLEMQRKKVAAAVSATKTRIVWPVLPMHDDDNNNDNDDEDNDEENGASSEGHGEEGDSFEGGRHLDGTKPRAATADSSNGYRGRSSQTRKAIVNYRSPFNNPAIRNGNGKGNKDGTGTGTGSFASQFPRASEDTRKFIDDLEDNERKIHVEEMRRRKKILKSVQTGSFFMVPLGSPNNRLTSLTGTSNSGGSSGNSMRAKSPSPHITDRGDRPISGHTGTNARGEERERERERERVIRSEGTGHISPDPFQPKSNTA